MIALVMVLTAIVLGLSLVATTKLQKARRRRALVEVVQSVPTLLVGDLLVRRAAPSDVDTIIETMDRIFMDANGWTRDVATAAAAQLRKTAPDVLGYVSVCGSDGTVLGYGVFSDVTPSRSRCSLGFSLHPSVRSRGLGAGALTAVVEAVHQAGVQTIVLGTRATNRAMASCITRAGGVEVRRGRKRLPDGSQPEAIWFEHIAER